MKCVSNNRFAYNAQAVADEKNGIIVACDVTSQENDVGQLPLMLKQAQQNIKSAAQEATDQLEIQKPLVAVADTGYGAAADIAAAQAEGFEVVTALPEGAPKKNKPYHSSNFHYDALQDVCICPQQQALGFVREKNRRGQIVREYRCRCKNCPVVAQCTQDPKGRAIEIGPHHNVVVAMRKTLASEQGRARLQRRAVIVEPRFATVKARQGFRRWTVRGVEKVKAQWHWICLTANLGILFRKWLTGALSWV